MKAPEEDYWCTDAFLRYFQMKLKIVIYSLIILGLIWIFFSLFVSGKITKEDKIKEKKKISGSEEGLEGFHFVETIGGKPQWELFAKKALISKTKTNLEEIHCTFFSSQKNEPILTIEAKTGIWDTDTRDIELRGDIKVITREGTEFTSNTLIWRADSGILITPEAVNVIYKQLHISGSGLEIDPEREKVEIKERVKIVIKDS